jgi:hypothetical protein
VVAEINAADGRAETIACDLSDFAQMQRKLDPTSPDRVDEDARSNGRSVSSSIVCRRRSTAEASGLLA